MDSYALGAWRLGMLGSFDSRRSAAYLRWEEHHRRDIMSLFRTLFAPRKSRAEFEHDYLCAAVSRYDLEQREREVARGRFAGY